MSRNEAPTPFFKLLALQTNTPALLDEISLVGQDAVALYAEFSDIGANCVVIPWVKVKGPKPGPTYPPLSLPGDVTDVDDEADVWVRLQTNATLTAVADSGNQPDPIVSGNVRAPISEFDCQGFDAIKFELVSVSAGTVSFWYGAKRRLY